MFHRTLTRSSVLAGVAGLVLGATAAADTANFARTTFDFDEWTLESHSKPFQGTEGGAVLFFDGFHPQYGGNLEARFFTPVPSRLFGMAFLDDATWDPAEGPIDSIDMTMTVIDATEGQDVNLAGRFYLEQGGRYYRYGGIENGFDGDVSTHIVLDLTAEDFYEVVFDNEDPPNPDSNPDFSQDGEPIRIGFGQDWLFNQFAGINFAWGYDNYGVAIHYSEPVQPACPGDANGDLLVNLADLNIVLANFGQEVPVGTNGDLTGDGVVNLQDLNRLLALFGTNCL